MNKVFKPRCPECGRVQADWVTEAQFTCPRCHLIFTIGDISISKITLLTNASRDDKVLINNTTE